MTSPLLLNAFEMLTPVHQSPGLWRHPESRAAEFASPAYWTEHAKRLEDAGFNSVFFADVLGVYDVYGGNAEATIKGGVQYPLLDPVVAVPAMAAATSTLGFGVTASVTYEKPYLLARTLSTLDHFTGGRVAWNIVTSYQDSAARNLGLTGQIPHDERYDRADEFMDVMYKAFEGSFAPGAVVADKVAGVFTDPAKVQGIDHHGKFFDVSGPALLNPGPQGTPFLFQAGASPRGQQFSIDHAEAIFFSGSTPQLVAGWASKVREGLVARGRAADAIKIFSLATVIVDATDEAAQARLDDYKQYVDVESALALFGGWTGVDLSGAHPDDTLEYVATDANQSALASFTTLSPEKKWTVRDLAEFVAIGGRGPVIVGSAATVVDELERWRDQAGVDGFNITAAVRPAEFERFGRYVTPELRRRGLLGEAAAGSTLREQLTGFAALPADHRGAGFRAVPSPVA